MQNHLEFDIKKYNVCRVFRPKKADVILSKKQNDITNFISIGIVCLYKSIFGSNEEKIMVYKRNFSKDQNTAEAFVDTQEISIPNNPLIAVSCNYVHEIINHITGSNDINNIMLGPQISMITSLYQCNVNLEIGMTHPTNTKDIFLEILPKKWKLSDTVKAQETAYKLILKIFELTTKPFI